MLKIIEIIKYNISVLVVFLGRQETLFFNPGTVNISVILVMVSCGFASSFNSDFKSSIFFSVSSLRLNSGLKLTSKTGALLLLI